jgi:hypothetical protein
VRWKKSAVCSAHTPPPFWLPRLLAPDSHIPKGYQGRSPWLVSDDINDALRLVIELRKIGNRNDRLPEPIGGITGVACVLSEGN